MKNTIEQHVSGQRIANEKSGVASDEYRLAVGRRFGERMLRGDCVLQSGASGFAGPPCTVSDGKRKSLSHVNALVAMQVMRDRGLVDPRFFTLAQINASGWALADGAVGVGAQYLVLPGGEDGVGTVGGEPVTKRFKVFHAGDVVGCPVWVRGESVAREDLVAALAEVGVVVPVGENGLAGALEGWSVGEVGYEVSAAGALLRADLVTTWLEAATGLDGLRSGLEGSISVVRDYGQAVVDSPLAFYAAVDDAVRLSSGLMDRVRAAQFERLTVQAVQSVEVDGSMASEKAGSKVSAWVERMFAQRQAILAVPFREKDRAQEAGAVWHKDKKLWFVPPGVELGLFKDWNPTETTLGPVASEAMLIADFEAAMKSMDLVLPTEIQADCKWHNVAIQAGGKKRSGSGAYLLNLAGGRDGVPCGSISNKLSGERFAWRYEGALLTPEQRAKAKAEAQAREWAAVREEQLQHDAAAGQAREIWADCEAADGQGYAAKKGISDDGVRQVLGSRLLACDAFVGESGRSAIRIKEMYTIVPLMTAGGEIRNLQAISADGKVKTFMRGAQKSGLMFVLGAESLDSVIEKGSPLVAYAEGWATGASFRSAVPVPVVVCFDAGNMEAVAQATMGKFSVDTVKVLAVDNDQFHVERALGALASTVGVNPYSTGSGDKVSVISRSGDDGLTGGATRLIDLGNVVADGEWQQGPKGKYCVAVEHEADGVSVRSLRVQMLTEAGEKSTQLYANRGAEVGKKCEGLAENCLVVSPWFESLDGMPTDWNDLMLREGVDVVHERVRNQLEHGVFERAMMKRPVAAGVVVGESQRIRAASVER